MKIRETHMHLQMEICMQAHKWKMQVKMLISVQWVCIRIRAKEFYVSIIVGPESTLEIRPYIVLIGLHHRSMISIREWL